MSRISILIVALVLSIGLSDAVFAQDVEQKTQNLIRVTRTAKDFQTEDFGACAFVPLIGEHGWKNNSTHS